MPPPTFNGDTTTVVGAEPLHPEHRADDVDDRVEGADLVQVHPLDRHRVDGGLGLGQPLEQVYRAILPACRQRRPVDEALDLLQAVVFVIDVSARARGRANARAVRIPGVVCVIVRGGADGLSAEMVVGMRMVVMRMIVRMPGLGRMRVRMRRGSRRRRVGSRSGRALFACTGTSSPRRRRAARAPRHAPSLDRKAAEGRAQLVERQPEIEQRAEHHVARRRRRNSRSTRSCHTRTTLLP